MQPGTTGLRYIQAHYTDVPCTIEIGVAMPTACRMRTGKALASALPKMQAGVAHLRRVRRGNEMHHDTSTLSFIGDEDPQLVEGPTVTTAPLRFLPGFLVGALADARQLFQGDGTTGAEGRANQVLADLVVGLALKTGFTPRQPCQKLPASAPRTSGAFRGFPLQGRTLAAIPITQSGQRLSAPVLIIAGVGNIGAPQVHAKDISGLSGHKRRTFELDMQKACPITALDQRGTRGRVALERPF